MLLKFHGRIQRPHYAIFNNTCNRNWLAMREMTFERTGNRVRRQIWRFEFRFQHDLLIKRSALSTSRVSFSVMHVDPPFD